MDKNLNKDDYKYKVFDLMQVGIWTIEIEDGKLPRMYADDMMKKLMGFTEDVTPQECYDTWYSRIFSSHINIVEQAMGKLIAGKYIEITYPWMSLDGRLRYVRCGANRDYSYENGLRFYGYHHDITHIILEQKQSEISEKPVISEYILQVLASIYDGIHIIDFRTQKATPLRTLNYEEWSGTSIDIGEYLGLLAHHIDEYAMKFIKRSVEHQDLIDENGNKVSLFSHDYCRNVDGNDHWYNVFVCMDESNSNTVMLVSFRDINEHKVEQQIAAKTIEKLRQQSEYDGLTGILNRSTIQSHIESFLQCKNTTQASAFILIDLDNFKKVNDTLGHIEGDVLLMETAEKLRQLCTNEGEEAGRIGGDEFVIFIQNAESQSYIERIVRQITKQLYKKYESEQGDIIVTASVGIAFSNDKFHTFSQLYNNADIALYKSKNAGKNQYTIYS